MRWRLLLFTVPVALVVFNVTYWMSSSDTIEIGPQGHWVLWILLILLTTPLQAAGEEFLFRGYLMQILGALMPWRWVVVLISAGVFTLMHGFSQNLAIATTRFGFGVLMGALLLLTGGLEAGIAAHAVNNVLAFGYAAVSPQGMASVRASNTTTWDIAAWNLGAYALVGLAAYAIARWLRAADRTPG
jgi:membrane protease YdiL (CAAX protease family)